MLADGYDLVIRAIPLPDSGLILRRLTAWRHILCCAPSYLDAHPAPTEPADIAHHNCLRFALYPFGDEWRFEGPDGKMLSVRVSGNLVTNSAETLRRMALAGHGLFLAPTFMIVDELVAGTLVPLLLPYRGVEFAINAIYRTAITSRPRCAASSTCWPSGSPNTANG